MDDTVHKGLKIHQDALISRIDLEKDSNFKYKLKSESHGVYCMIIHGEVYIDGENYSSKDAVGISETTNFQVSATTNSEILFIEVPMY